MSPRHLSIIAFVTVFLLSSPSLAQQDRASATLPRQSAEPSATTGTAPLTTPAATTRGLIPNKQVIDLPDATPGEIKEADGVYASCNGSEEADYFDCKCMSLAFLQRRITDRVTLKSTGLAIMRDEARAACPNLVGIAGRMYTTCMSWAPKMRPDYEEFCTCYGNAYAQKFGKTPALSYGSYKYLMKAALKSCNAGSTITDRMTRDKRIEELKKQGLYEQLFPSAKELPQPTGPQPAAPRSSQLAPSQRLSDRLFDQATPRDKPEE